ncbi:MAG: tetratricopeptide repeat protein, partial [Duncaniella sp.]|nr:tetratricopeptide repeat protein [Duncaniella sp.]
MKKIKIFLASSEDLVTETLELSDLVEHLNLILEKQDIHIYLCKWEYLQSKEDYDDTLDSSDLSLVIFGKDFGSYSEEDLKKVYERVCKEGANPQKLYVYFKAGEDQTEALKKFRDSFPDQFGHFAGNFADVNALRADFMLQFQLFQNQNNGNAYCNVKVKDGKVFLNEKEVFIDMMKVPFMGNNETYTDLCKRIEKQRRRLKRMEPEDEDYADEAQELQDLEEKKEKMEASLWDTALDITRLSNQKCSERLQRAIDLFNQGDNKGANAILNEEEIIRDAENNLNLIKLGEEGRKGLITNIEELKLKVKTLENEMSEGWLQQIIEISKKIVDYTEKIYSQNSEEYISSLLFTGEYLSAAGNYGDALTYGEKANKIAEEVLGEKHPDTATSYNNVGVAYGELGDYNKALENYEKALKIRLGIFGENHPDVATSYNNIGAVYFDQGDYGRALENYEQALNIQLGIFGENHPDVATSYNNIGLVYFNQGDYSRALEYHEKALKIRLEIFGENHPDVATSYNNIGLVYFDQGDYGRALENFEKALRIRLGILGENHPNVATSYNNIGFVYSNQGDYGRALENYEKAL